MDTARIGGAGGRPRRVQGAGSGNEIRMIPRLCFIGLHVAALVSAFLLACTLISVPAVIASEDGSPAPQTINDLKVAISALLSESGAPGVGVALVSKDSVIWAGGIGVAEIETGEPVTEATLFRLGSVAKSFVAVGILKLVEDGKLSLDSPLRDVIPEIEIENPWAATDPVRVVHLLEHTSGFEDLHQYEYFNVRHDPDISTRDYLAINPHSRNVMWKPGTKAAYSSHGYAVARYVIEKASGRRFEDYMQEAILDPIGMTSSSFGLRVDNRERLARGYDANGEQVQFGLQYKRSLYSSAAEMALFTQVLLNRGRAFGAPIISGASVDRMERPITAAAARAGLNAGYGLGNRPRFVDGHKYYGHSGSILGFTSVYSYFPNEGLGCVVLINCSSCEAYGKIRRLIQRYLLRDEPTPPRPVMQLPTEQLQRFIGLYSYSNPTQRLMRPMLLFGGNISITLENGSLYANDIGGRRRALIPVSENKFRREDESEATIVFAESDDGKLFMADPIYYDEYERTASWKPLVSCSLLIAAVVAMLSSMAYAIYWVPVHLFRCLTSRKSRSVYVMMRVLPLLAVLILVSGMLAVYLQGVAAMVDTGLYNWATMYLYLATILFPVLSLLSVGSTVRSFFKPVARTARIYALIVSSACLGFASCLGYWGLIGFKAWAY